MLKPMLLSATAPGSCVRGTMSPTDACHAGPLNAAPHPIRKVNSSSNQGVIAPVHAHTASPMETRSMNTCAPSITLRRSRLSAIAPANNDSNMIGNVTDVCTSATMCAESAIDVIIQEAPTDWIKPPRLEIVLAIQTARNVGKRNGEIAETGTASGVGSFEGGVIGKAIGHERRSRGRVQQGYDV
jgi:hypothetical protein